MNLTFLGTGGAWRLPELNCNCLVCQELRRRKEKRDGRAYSIPLNQRQWQATVDRILSDRHLPFKVTVAHDDLQVTL